MIRIIIVARTAARAQAVARLLADERLDILDARASGAADTPDPLASDVVIAVGLSVDQIPRWASRIVVASDAPAPRTNFGSQVYAWLSSSSSATELSAAIFAAACDLTVFTPDQLHSRRQPADRTGEPGYFEKLTPRELQVLRMLSDGLGNKQIAAQLGLSDHTAKFHVAQILAKLGVASRTEAVSVGIRRGLVPL